MVQILPTLGEQLTPIIAQISDNVAKLIDPNYKAKSEMHQKIMSDPVYAQQVADFLHENPDVAKTLGKRDQKTLASMKESKTSQTQGKIEQGVLNEVSTPEGLENAISKQLYGKDKVGRELDKLELEDKQRQGVINQLGMQSIDAASNFILTHPDANFGSLIRGFFNGTVKGDLISGLFQNPKSAGAMKIAWEKYQEDRRDAREDRKDQRQRDFFLQEKKQMAVFGMALDQLKDTGVGDIDTHYGLISNPALRERAEQLANNPSDIKTDADKKLVNTYNAIRQLDATKRQTAINKDMTLVKGLQAQLDKASSDEKEPLVAQMNDIFSHMSLLGGPQIIASYNPAKKQGHFGLPDVGKPNIPESITYQTGDGTEVDPANLKPIQTNKGGTGGKGSGSHEFDQELFNGAKAAIEQVKKDNPDGWRARLTPVIRAMKQKNTAVADRLAKEYGVDLTNDKF